MFGFYPNSRGGVDVPNFIGEMEAELAIVAARTGGQGFVEVVETILSALGRSGNEMQREGADAR
ncbi:hypothetical protein VQ042_10080 [Aurantimonas sp. A2-1-M11]|uniref:hypothetical protein n=1 Tax=Aurantimonas sp. A2-1-M11 TaxID=3113712 RepID=UPI002F944542